MKSFEGPETKVESLEHRKLRVANGIQMRLMGLMCNPEDGADCFNEWPGKYGQKFADLFEHALINHTGMLDEWDTNPEKYVDLFMAEFLTMPGEAEERLAA